MVTYVECGLLTQCETQSNNSWVYWTMSFDDVTRSLIQIPLCLVVGAENYNFKPLMKHGDCIKRDNFLSEVIRRTTSSRFHLRKTIWGVSCTLNIKHRKYSHRFDCSLGPKTDWKLLKIRSPSVSVSNFSGRGTQTSWGGSHFQYLESRLLFTLKFGMCTWKLIGSSESTYLSTWNDAVPLAGTVILHRQRMLFLEFQHWNVIKSIVQIRQSRCVLAVLWNPEILHNVT